MRMDAVRGGLSRSRSGRVIAVAGSPGARSPRRPLGRPLDPGARSPGHRSVGPPSARRSILDDAAGPHSLAPSSADRRAAPPRTPGPYGPTAARRGWTSTGASTSAGSRSTAARSTSSSSARATADRVRPRPRRLVAELAGEHPRTSRRAPPRRSRSTCRASARRAMPAREDLDPRLRALVDALLERARRRAARRGRQLDGRLHRRRARDPVPGTRVERLVLVSRRGPLDRVPAQRARPRRAATVERLHRRPGAASSARARTRSRGARGRARHAHAARRAPPRAAPGAARRRAGARRRASPASSTRSTR